MEKLFSDKKKSILMRNIKYSKLNNYSNNVIKSIKSIYVSSRKHGPYKLKINYVYDRSNDHAFTFIDGYRCSYGSRMITTFRKLNYLKKRWILEEND